MQEPKHVGTARPSLENKGPVRSRQSRPHAPRRPQCSSRWREPQPPWSYSTHFPKRQRNRIEEPHILHSPPYGSSKRSNINHSSTALGASEGKTHTAENHRPFAFPYSDQPWSAGCRGRGKLVPIKGRVAWGQREAGSGSPSQEGARIV